jgi:hypothetical protein
MENIVLCVERWAECKGILNYKYYTCAAVVETVHVLVQLIVCAVFISYWVEQV